MNIRRWLITLVSCLLIFVALAGFKFFQIKAAIAYGESFPEPSATVEAEQVKSLEVQKKITTIGEVISPQTVALRNELEGRIVAVNFTSGAVVKKGDVLLELDASEEVARLQAAKARAKLAQLDLARVEKLVKERTVSREQLDQAEANLNVANAEVDGIQVLIDKKTIKAPFTGKSGIHLFEVGQFLDRNTLITTLVGVNNFHWVDFSLPVSQQAVEIGMPVEVVLSRLSDEPLTGYIVAKDSIASTSSRNLRFRAKLETQIKIPSNTIAKVNVITGKKVATQIPITSLLYDSMGTFVYRLIPDSESNAYRGKRQKVIVGKEDENTITILEGLSPDMLIATQGSFKVSNDLLVYVADRQAKNPPAVVTE